MFCRYPRTKNIMSSANSDYSHLYALVNDYLAKSVEKRKDLQELDLFVLDNSLRESTVGQVRGHSLDNKWAILEEVKKCGYDHIIVGAFSHMPRVDDSFVAQLVKKEPGMVSKFFGFSEIRESREDLMSIPVGLQKMIEYGIPNPIFEVDIASFIDGDDCVERMSTTLERRFKDTRDHFKDAKILVNIRDFAVAMTKHPHYVYDIVKFIAKRKPEEQIFGLLFEEPMGKFYPEQLGAYTNAVRALMNECNWKNGYFLVHIHEKWQQSEVCVEACLSNGANGVWASVAAEGAGIGHACSTITVMNLIRMGNKKVMEKYNCVYMRQAAINVTKITTGLPPPPRQPIYGERALDTVFDMQSSKGCGPGEDEEFSLAEFYGVKAPIRITSVASYQMIVDKLVDVFGPNDQFTIEMARNMKVRMISNLTTGHKEEYMTPAGLAILFDSAGGHLTHKMAETIAEVEINSKTHKLLIQEVRGMWDKWDREGDDGISFYSFYNGFMSPYFGCYECEDTRKGLQAIDMDQDGTVDWQEFIVYLQWALNQYPEISTSTELLATAFTRALIPAMQDEIIRKP